MSDTNNSWERIMALNELWTETVTRAEFGELYGHKLTDDEWIRLQGALENAVADVISAWAE